jgi:hypothetical protein
MEPAVIWTTGLLSIHVATQPHCNRTGSGWVTRALPLWKGLAVLRRGRGTGRSCPFSPLSSFLPCLGICLFCGNTHQSPHPTLNLLEPWSLAGWTPSLQTNFCSWQIIQSQIFCASSTKGLIQPCGVGIAVVCLSWRWSGGLNSVRNGRHPWKLMASSQVLVAHACNLSYSGGRDQEDCSSKPALGK